MSSDKADCKRFYLNTVIAASQGDSASMSVLLKHYDGYINKLSQRVLYDADGSTYFVIDDTLRSFLVDVFIHTTMKFTFKCTD